MLKVFTTDQRDRVKPLLRPKRLVALLICPRGGRVSKQQAIDTFARYLAYVRHLKQKGLGIVQPAVRIWLTKSPWAVRIDVSRSEEHTSELQSPCNLVC